MTKSRMRELIVDSYPLPPYELKVRVLWKGAKDFETVDLMKLEGEERYFFVQKRKSRGYVEGRTPPMRFDPAWDRHFAAEWWAKVGIPGLGRYFLECRRKTSVYQTM
jgi:hypothetical protein